MTRSAFISSPELWKTGHGASHPLKPERLRRTHALLEAYGAFDSPTSRIVAPRAATDKELCLFHAPHYVAAVKSLSRGERRYNPAQYNFGPGDNPVFPGMYEVESLKVGAALVAAELVAREEVDVAFSFAGGLHHAGPAQAYGFCVFNDAAVAIHYLVQQGLKVAYVDIDAHHADGVQAAFYDTDQVLTISLHESGDYLFPGTGYVDEIGAGKGRGFSVNVPLLPSTDDQIYFWAFREVVPPLIARFHPDIVVTQLGIDTHYRDPLAHLNLTTAGYVALLETLKSLAPHWVALGGGGYDLSVVPRAWTLAYGVMSGQTFPNTLPESFQQLLGYETLHDANGPETNEAARVMAKRYVEAQVRNLKRLLNLP